MNPSSRGDRAAGVGTPPGGSGAATAREPRARRSRHARAAGGPPDPPPAEPVLPRPRVRDAGVAGPLLDGRYRLGPRLARGGMSTVYRGTDIRLDRPVAVKVMDPRLAADPAFRIRFEREARSAARIHHPNVIAVHDQGEELRDGEPTAFLVMELVDGGTLRDVLRARGQLGVPAALAVLEPVLAGLAEAHRLGMVHRDVKPENVLIGAAGDVRIADFGLVAAAAQAGASHAGAILGTVAYLSPEQVETGAADARSDVYAAGILLYELLTGAPPYTGDTALSVAYRHVNADVPAPSQIAGDVPPELDDLVGRATRRDPAARPADAGEFLAELCRVADLLEVPRVPVPVPPPPPVDQQDTVPAGARSPAGTRLFDRTAQDEPPAAPPAHVVARRRSRRLFAVWVAVVLALGLALGTVAWWLGAGRWTVTPSVVGLDRAAAERVLADADLVPRVVAEAFDDRFEAGVVATADPAPDSRLLRGSEVRLTVSTGRPTVPQVVAGTPVAAAEQALRDAALTPVQNTGAAEFSESVPAGAVIRTDPAAGTPLAIGAPVTLVLSKGPEPQQVRVPFVVGEKADDAAHLLEEEGFEVEIRGQFPFGRDNGRVIGQSPGPGSLVDPEETVIVLDTF